MSQRICDAGGPRDRWRSSPTAAAWRGLLVVLAVLLWGKTTAAQTPATAQTPASQSSPAQTSSSAIPATYTLAVHVSSDKPPATGPEETHAIRELVTLRAARINAAGGIRGRPLQIAFFDDGSDAERTKANVEAALALPNLVGMIGIWNSTRGAGVVERIGESGVPWISELSVETLFARYSTVYTLTRSVRDEQEVFRAFAADNVRRVVFIGDEADLYTRTYQQHLARMSGATELAASLWLTGDLDAQPARVAEIVADVRRLEPDLLFLSLGSKRGASLLGKLAEAGVRLPVFVGLGSINGILAEEPGRAWGGTLYEVAEGGIANLNNERLESLMRRPGALPPGRQFSAYAVGYGARYSDLVSLMAEAAGGPGAADVASVRQRIAADLARLGEGRRVYRGAAQDWSFSSERASAERSLLVRREEGQAAPLLAPIQYVRTGRALARVPVLYVHLDMTRIHQVDSNAKSFDAEFFFTIRAEVDVPIGAVEFTNAIRGPSGTPLISVREVHDDAGLVTVPPTEGATTARSRIYKVSGRFAFEPDLRKYPFDEQILSISFQPASTQSAFLLQPPSAEVRDKAFAIDGWRMLGHYVGTSEQIIRSVFGAASEERILSYYNFNYTWVMKRQVIDYLLRVVVPLFFIMLVAYLANFIPRSEFEAIIAIQVTSLLSAIALYLALSQPQADDATLSDQIFVMAYATISTMIALSIFEVNTTLERMPRFQRVVTGLQIYLVPVAAVALIGYILTTAAS